MAVAFSEQASPPSSGRRLAFVAIGVLALGVVLEIVAFVGLSIVDGRLFGWSDAARRLEQRRSASIDAPLEAAPAAREVTHPYLGYTRNPDRRPELGPFGFPASTESFTRRAPDTVVAAVVGGSVAYHFAEEASAALRERFENDPRHAGQRLVVSNLAVGGYKQPQQLMTLSYLLSLGFEFDVVINIDGFNEVALHPAENGHKGVFPAYPRAWYSRSNDWADSRHVALAGRMVLLDERRGATAASFARAPWRWSACAHLVWRVVDAWIGLRHDRAVEAFRAYQPSAGGYRTLGPAVAIPTRVDGPSASSEAAQLVALWRRSSLQIDRLCRANGIRYLHFLQPNQYVSGSKRLSADELELAYRDDHPYRDGAQVGYPGLRRAGRELLVDGVEFVDLTELFIDEERTVYVDDCCHVNALGNELMARQVARALLGTGRTGTGTKSGFRGQSPRR